MSNNSSSLCTPKNMPAIVDIPVSLNAANQGKFFIGYADELAFSEQTSAWAGLYNPPDSGVILYVNFWSVSDISNTSYRIQAWFNAAMPGTASISPHSFPSNFAIYPLPVPRCQIVYASNVTGEPYVGTKAFVRRGLPNVSNSDTESGKLIFPPGGLFALDVSSPETPQVKATGTIYFEWWEEAIR